MKASPIYNLINNPKRKSDCSFGAGDRFSQEIRVGTSSSNSHRLGSISVERYIDDDGLPVFSMYLDGILVKQGVLDGHDFTMVKG